MRLRTLLILTFGSIALALSLIASWAIKARVAERIEQRTGGELAGIAAQIRDGLDRGLYERLRDIQIAASHDVLRDANATVEAKRRVLRTLQETYPLYAIITLVDPQGKILITSKGLIEGADVSKRTYFMAGREGPFAADVHDAILLAGLLGGDPNNPPRFVDLSAPITGEGGAFLGVLAAHLNWDWARDIEQSLMEPLRKRIADVDVIILASDGTVLLGPPELVKQKLSGQQSSIRQALDRGTGFQLEKWPDGTEYVTGFNPTKGFRDYKGLGWTVLVRQKAATAFTPAERLGQEIMLGGLIAAAVFALIGYWAAGQIAGPLLSLSQVADKLRGGDETSELPNYRSFAEVETLSNSLKALVDRLEQRRIAEAQAERDRAYAESANQAKSDFLASMSHEIRTPLNGILGFTDLILQRNDLADDVRRRLVLIQIAGHSLLTVVNDILDYSKIEAGELALCSDPFRPEMMIDNALSLIRGSGEQKGIDVVFDSPRPLPVCLVGDEGRLRQVLLNLLNNAIKFTSEGSVTLHVACEIDDSAGVVMHVEVRDTGIGIAPEKLDRLFKRFSQVDNSIGREFGGTGLGLAISKRLVELMGGAIGVSSELGKGSTFWFSMTLPLGSVEHIEEKSFEQAFAISERPARILLAEDLPMNQEIVQSILTATGHQLDIVGNGEEAVLAVQREAYDLVLMDVQMPVLDGVRATRQIRALGTHPNLPIIALTANVMPEQLALFREAGMDDHVGKPFSPVALVETIERWLHRRQVKQVVRKDEAPLFDGKAYTDIVELVGQEKVDGWLSSLMEQLEAGVLAKEFANLPRDEQIHQVHVVVSQSGMLGFTRLSKAHSALEIALHNGDNIQPALEEVKSAAKIAMRDARKLLDGAAMPAAA